MRTLAARGTCPRAPAARLWGLGPAAREEGLLSATFLGWLCWRHAGRRGGVPRGGVLGMTPSPARGLERDVGGDTRCGCQETRAQPQRRCPLRSEDFRRLRGL